MIAWLLDPEIWLGLLTLTFLEIVLGIDNIIVISILAAKVEKAKQDMARRLGISFALITRLMLLASLAWLAGLTEPLFTLWGGSFSGRDLVLIVGGIFLLLKSTQEIHQSLEAGDDLAESVVDKGRAGVIWVVTQIALMDIVFSLDSVITAIGMSNKLGVMIAAVVIAMGVMLWLSKPVGDFVHRHPTIKILALSFLLLIGVMLVAEGFGHHIPKGYIYSAMGFSLMVELLNMRLRKTQKPPVDLYEPGE